MEIYTTGSPAPQRCCGLVIALTLSFTDEFALRPSSETEYSGTQAEFIGLNLLGINGK